MSKFDNDKVMPRYFAIAVVLTLLGVAIIGKAMYIMTAKKDYWEEVASRLKRDSVDVRPNRGNILSCDGQLMASSLPEFKMYMDFVAGGEEKDSLWEVKLDSIWDSTRYFLRKVQRSLDSIWKRDERKSPDIGLSGLNEWTTTRLQR